MDLLGLVLVAAWAVLAGAPAIAWAALDRPSKATRTPAPAQPTVMMRAALPSARVLPYGERMRAWDRRQREARRSHLMIVRRVRGGRR